MWFLAPKSQRCLPCGTAAPLPQGKPPWLKHGENFFAHCWLGLHIICFNYKPHKKTLVQWSLKFTWAELTRPPPMPHQTLILLPTQAGEEKRKTMGLQGMKGGGINTRGNILLPQHWIKFPRLPPLRHLLSAHTTGRKRTQAKPDQELMLMNISPAFCFLLLKEAFPQPILPVCEIHLMPRGRTRWYLF